MTLRLMFYSEVSVSDYIGTGWQNTTLAFEKVQGKRCWYLLNIHSSDEIWPLHRFLKG